MTGGLEQLARLSGSACDNKADKIGSTLKPVGALFDVMYGNSLELVRLDRARDGINFVSRTSRNNGVSAKVKRLPDVAPVAPPVITVAAGGSVLEAFVQIEPFYSGRDLFYLKPKTPMTLEEMFFYCTCIKANQFRYSYGRQANRTLRNLPVPARDAIPSWVYGSLLRIADECKHTTRMG